MPNPPPHPQSKLTEAMVTDFCREIERGQAVPFAAKLAGSSRSRVFAWLALGRAAEEADEVPAGFGVGESPERYLWDHYACARARLAGQMADAIRENKTGPGERNHTAMAYFERTRFPDVFSDRALEAATLALEPSAAPTDASADPGAVTVELCRCPSCGADQLPGKAWCGDCRAAMPAKAGESGGLRSRQLKALDYTDLAV